MENGTMSRKNEMMKYIRDEGQKGNKTEMNKAWKIKFVQESIMR